MIAGGFGGDRVARLVSGLRGRSRFDEDARVHDVVGQAGERADHGPQDRLAVRHRGFYQVEGILPGLCPGHDVAVFCGGPDGAVVQVELAHAGSVSRRVPACAASQYGWPAGPRGAGMSRWTVLLCWRSSTTRCAATRRPSPDPGSNVSGRWSGSSPVTTGGAGCCGLT